MNLYKVMLVDDEKYARLWLRNCVPWQELGFMVIGEAASGKDALELVSRLSPDLIVSDMEMSHGDGVMLMEKIGSQFPDVYFIIVSGYDKFEYLQSAVQNNAVDYLLKPLKPEELQAVLAKVKTKLDVKRDEKERLLQTNREQLFLRQEQVIIKLLGGMQASRDLEELAGKQMFWLVALLECGESFEECREILQLEAEKSGIRIISAALSGQLICVLGGDDASALSCWIETVSMQLPESCIKVTVGSPKDNPEHISACYTEAHLSGIGAVSEKSLRYFQYQPSGRIKDVISFEQEQVLAASMRMLNYGQAREVIEAIFGQVQDLPQSKMIARTVYTKLLSILIRYGFEIGNSFERLGFYEVGLFAQANRLKSFEEFKAASMELLKDYFEQLSKLDHGKRSVVASAKAYVLANYTRDISLNEIADGAGVSANHLCSVFKTETGESVFDFVSSVRIERAKELLVRPDTKVYEVARIVGYSDSKYFGRVFKRFMGISPGEYRKKHKRH